MIRYTTPTYELVVEGIDITAETVYVTFRQHGTLVTIEGPSMELDEGDTVITCSLTQQQSASFRDGTMEVQVNWIDAHGDRGATLVKQVPVEVQLLEEVK